MSENETPQAPETAETENPSATVDTAVVDADAKPKRKHGRKAGRIVATVAVGAALLVGGGAIGYGIGSSNASQGPQGEPPVMQQQNGDGQQQGQGGPGGNGQQQPPSDGQAPQQNGNQGNGGNGGSGGSGSTDSQGSADSQGPTGSQSSTTVS